MMRLKKHAFFPNNFAVTEHGDLFSLWQSGLAVLNIAFVLFGKLLYFYRLLTFIHFGKYKI